MAQVIYLTSQSATLYCTHRRGAHARGRFDCTEAGFRELARQLATTEPQPVAILADLIEEEFRLEILPHTFGGDRKRLLGRNAGKLFRGTPFRHHRVIGRQSDGRRDDRVLFSALTNRDNIEPLLSVLDESCIPVKGIYSLPLLTRPLMKPLATGTGNALVITAQPDGGLRETFVCDGSVQFSRLAPVSAVAPTDYCQVIRSEAHKTRRYLISLKLLPANEVLDVYALCDSPRLEALGNLPAEEGDIRIHALNLAQVAERLGFTDHPDIHLADALFCYLLEKKASANHYAKASHLRHWHSYRLRFGLRAASWLLAVGSLTLAGMNIVDGRLVEQETQQLNQLAAQVSEDSRRVARGLPLKPVEAIAMREALQIADHLNAYPADPGRLFTLLGSAFSLQPGLAMDRLDWFVASTPDEEATTGARRTDGPATLESKPFLISFVRGHMPGFSCSYREAHNRIDHLVHWLQIQPGIHSATVVRQPLNTRPDTSLQGSVGGQGEREAADFELRVVMELEHGSA